MNSIFPSSRPNISVRVIPKIPATLHGVGGIGISKENGNWTIEPAWDDLALLTPGILLDPVSKELWVHDPVTDIYYRMTLGGLGQALFWGASVTPNLIGAGSRTFTTQSGKDWLPGMFVQAFSASAITNYMIGQVTAYAGNTLTVNVLAIGGSGTPNDWTIVQSSLPGSGPPGTPGISGGLNYRFVASLSGDPGAGGVGFDSPTIIPVTQMRISNVDRNGIDISTAIALWDDSTTAPHRARVRVYSAANPAKFITATINGPMIDQGTYKEFPLSTPVGAVFPDVGDCQVEVYRTGDMGIQGPPGVPGGVVTIGDTPPIAPVNGQEWYESDTGKTYIWYDDGTSAQWVHTNGSASGSTGGAGAGTLVNIAALKATTVTPDTRLFVAGYYAEGDGGGGWFYADVASIDAGNDGTIIAPTVGTGRWKREFQGQNFNVKWFGLKGDGTTESLTQLNAARDAAIAVKGGLYFPATVGRYLLPSAGLVIPDNTHGLRIFGDAISRLTPGAVNTGSCIACAGVSVIDMTGVALNGSGSITNIVIEHLSLFASGSPGKTIKAWNLIGFIMSNVVLLASQGTALDMSGTAEFIFNKVAAYGSPVAPAVIFADLAVGAQPCGPGTWDAGQASIAANASTPVLALSGDFPGVIFKDVMFSSPGGTAAAVVSINGPIGAGAPVGSIAFQQCHSESTYNGTSTGVTFLIGNTKKAGTVIVEGGNYWGHGNGTLFMRDFIQIVAARHVVVKDVTASKLAAVNGFSRSMIRLETTFPTAGDTYDFSGLLADISGTMYSDASGVITGTGAKTNETINNVTLDSLAYTPYTPVLNSSVGTITTFGVHVGGYKRIGRMCHFWAHVFITTNGTGSGRLEVTLPFSAVNSAALPCVFRASGIVCSCSVLTHINATKCLIFNSSGAYPGADGAAFVITGAYETA